MANSTSRIVKPQVAFMKNALPIMSIALVILFGCTAPRPPTNFQPRAVSPGPRLPSQYEIDSGRRASRPTSQESAQQAVKIYFASRLKDPYSSRYGFLKPVNSYYIVSKDRKFGWFMCGKINSKNSYGGYVGERSFISYFDPKNGDKILGGFIESGKYKTVDPLCDIVYFNKDAILLTGEKSTKQNLKPLNQGNATAKSVFTSGNVFDINKVDQLTPKVSTEADAKRLLGAPTSVTSMAHGAQLLQWLYSQGTATGGSGAHVAILFDQEGKMIRVQHRLQTGL